MAIRSYFHLSLLARLETVPVATLAITVQASLYLMPDPVRRRDWVTDPMQSTERTPPDNQSAIRRWRLVYIAVVAFAALMILSLFLFSQHYSG